MNTTQKTLAALVLVLAGSCSALWAAPDLSKMTPEEILAYGRRLRQRKDALERRYDSLSRSKAELRREHDQAKARHDRTAHALNNGHWFLWHYGKQQVVTLTPDQLQTVAQRKQEVLSPEDYRRWVKQVKDFHRQQVDAARLPDLKARVDDLAGRIGTITDEMARVKADHTQTLAEMKALRADQIRKGDIRGRWRNGEVTVRFVLRDGNYVGYLERGTTSMKSSGFRAEDAVVHLRRAGEGTYEGKLIHRDAEGLVTWLSVKVAVDFDGKTFTARHASGTDVLRRVD